VSTEVVVDGRAFHWRDIDLNDGGTSYGWAHHDVACMPEGLLVTGRPDGAALTVRQADGRVVHEIPLALNETHCIRSAGEDLAAGFWVTDNGHRYVPEGSGYGEIVTGGRVVRVLPDATIAAELKQPEIEAYAVTGWMPTALAIDTTNGTIWVADGYSQSLLHAFTPTGGLTTTLDGSSSGTAFLTPHALLIDTRTEDGDIYVADRGNRRIVVLDRLGSYLRTVGEGVLTSPSGLALSGDLLVVAELFGAVAVFDKDDVCIARIGRGADGDQTRPGWPNIEADGVVSRPPLVTGDFNSPHGVAAAANGTIYITEWLVGGRLVELSPV
jgi:DNA-binding beta-propeller fold protein YncE